MYSEYTTMTKQRRTQRHSHLVLLALFFAFSMLLTYRTLAIGNKSTADLKATDWIFLPPEFLTVKDSRRQELQETHVITIPYAVSVTSCTKRELLMNGAAVLQHSIHLNSIRTPSSGSHYDYQMVAFVHPGAVDCADIFDTLNYTVLMKPVPFQINQIRGRYRRWANRSGCCGEKEWLKLYTYTLTQYPVAVHLDLDCLVLKPLDNLFDAMIMTTTNKTVKDVASSRSRIPAMWVNATDLPETIDFFFTRDYGMVQEPGRRKPHQIGVQGGFLVLRPNRTAFQEFVDIILEGDYTDRDGWGRGKLGFGGYYGARTIQGLASMYYSHLHPERAVEINRCLYNNMADSPYPRNYVEPKVSKSSYPCLTTQDTCEDCRETHVSEIFSIHLTNCLKPWQCYPPKVVPLLCVQHWYEWYRVRYLVEAKWQGQERIVPRIIVGRNMTIHEISFGFCSGVGRKTYSSIEPSWKIITVKPNNTFVIQ